MTHFRVLLWNDNYLSCGLTLDTSFNEGKMSWGTELWDQYDHIAAHTNKGIDFLERYGSFIRDRSAIESEYAGKLRRLVKAYTPKKKDEEEYQQFSCQKAFREMINEINDQAGQHEVVAENLTMAIAKEIVTLVKDLKDERKRALHEGARLQTALNQQLSTLERSQKNYEKAFREAERAEDAYRKADADLNLSRADVEKHRITSSIKNHQSEDTKTEYAKQLQKTNELQNQHYQTLLPAVFQQLQETDHKRIKQIENFIRKGVEIERNVFPIINTCLDGIIRAADGIDSEKDVRLVVEKFKSGFPHPEDIPFEDLSVVKNGSSIGSDSSTGGGINSTINLSGSGFKSETKSGTMSAIKQRKRSGIFGIFNAGKASLSALIDPKEDCSDLAPNQRRKKLQQKVDEIQTRVTQETATRDGLMKMKGVYEQNRALGDPLSIEGQLTESGQKLDKLRLELQKFQSYLDEAEGRVTAPTQNTNRLFSNGSNSNRPSSNGSTSGLSGLKKLIGSNKGSNCTLPQHGGSDDSLSRSASDSSVSNPNVKLSLPGTPQPCHGSSHSPESGVGSHTSHTSLPDSEVERLYANAEAEIGAEDDDEFDDPEPLPVLGTCRALYAFEAQSEGSIPLHEGEELSVIEIDQGDGWTRVRRNCGEDEGFVPTSYIQCTLYDSC